jgi:hypothetical protein
MYQPPGLPLRGTAMIPREGGRMGTGARRGRMARRARRGLRRLAIITVLIPLAAWALDEAARRAEARGDTSPWGRRLRQGADWVGGFGRGPLASRMRRQRP